MSHTSEVREGSTGFGVATVGGFLYSGGIYTIIESPTSNGALNTADPVCHFLPQQAKLTR